LIDVGDLDGYATRKVGFRVSLEKGEKNLGVWR
jgi:hypothetical protein